ncbi:putative FCH domain only protein 2, partial [Scophthalmus maximus]
MITPFFLEHFWGEKNNGFDVLYHNMKHGQISSKELTDFIRERSTIEEAYARSMTKLAKSAGNFSQLGTFAPVWDVFKSSTEKLASCHMELVRKLQELIKEVQKYVEEQAKAHKKTKEEVASTLEAVQNIQTISQALQKSKEIYNAKTVEQERLRKEGATQRDVDKAGVKAKKATETYKAYVEKYATAKSEFEQKMAETAQKFQDIEESHILHMKEIIQSYSQSVDETHIQIGELHSEFVRNIENTSVESLIQKLAESKGTGKERPGPIEFEECNTAIATEGAKPRKRKPFGIPGRRKDKDTDSTESTEVEAANVPQVDAEGFCISCSSLSDSVQIVTSQNSFYSSSDSEDEEEPRKFHVEIKPVEPNNGTHQNRATIDELKASIGNIILSPSTLGQMRRNQSSDELARTRVPTSYELTNNDLLSLDPFGPTLAAASTSSVSSSAGNTTPFYLCTYFSPQRHILPFIFALCHTSLDKIYLASFFLSMPSSPSFLMNDSDVFLPEASELEHSSASVLLGIYGQFLFLLMKDKNIIIAYTREVMHIWLKASLQIRSAIKKSGNQLCNTSMVSVFLIQLHQFFPHKQSCCLLVTLCTLLCFCQSHQLRQLRLCHNRSPLFPWRRASNPKISPLSLHPHPLRGTRQKTLPKHSNPYRRGPRAPPSPYPLSQLTPSEARSLATLQRASMPSPPCPGPRASGSLSVISLPHLAARARGRAKTLSTGVVPVPNRPTTPLTAGALVPPPRPSSRPKLSTGKLTGINEIVRNYNISTCGTLLKLHSDVVRPFSPPKTSNASPPPAPLARAESSSSLSSNASLSAGNTPTVGTSRGPSPVTLASQDALPIAVAFTESVNAYFKGADPTKTCFETGLILDCRSKQIQTFKPGDVLNLEPQANVLDQTRSLQQILVRMLNAALALPIFAFTSSSDPLFTAITLT